MSVHWLLLGWLWLEGDYSGWIAGRADVDLDGDGHTDRAILVLRADVADLHVWTRAGHAVGRAVAWRGPMYGQAPSLEVEGSGLVVHSENSSIGRSRWRRSLELRWQQGELRVTRERFVAYDTVEAEVTTECRQDLVAAGRDVAFFEWSYERPPCA